MSPVERAKLGEASAWGELHRQLTPRLVVYFRGRSYGDTVEGPEDLASETWLLAASKIHEFSGNDQQFQAWLFTLARGLLFNANRKVARRQTYSTDQLELLDGESFEGDWAPVEQILELVPVEERELILLVDVMGFPIKEAAVICGLTATNARVRRHRILKKLKKQLSEDGQPR